jgi:hypothetical protein
MLLPKPTRGSAVLEREKHRAEREKAEREAKLAAKARDGFRCRWPLTHKCRGGLEAAHILDASLGGACEPANLVSLCAWLHRRGPESIHGKQLKVEPMTHHHANGPLQFWRKDEDGSFYLVAEERSVGIVERD